MRIANVRIVRYTGRLDREVGLTPLSMDPRPERRLKGARHSDKRLILETDAGISGMAPHVHDRTVEALKNGLSEWLVGRDPMAVERNWVELCSELDNRAAPRDGAIISPIDWAMWDIRAKAMGVPAHAALGGPGRDRIRTYGSTSGIPSARSGDLAQVCDFAVQIKELGFFAQKWFLRYGPDDGEEPKRIMTNMVRMLRETLGDDAILMLDVVCKWDLPYAIDMCRRLAEYKPYWLEDPMPPDPSDDWARLRDATDIPLAGCDRLPDRWAFREFLERDLVEFVQPDEYNVKGLTEMSKVVTLASAWRKTIAPHCGYPATQHVLAAVPPPMDPWYEYLVNWNEYGQWFFKQRNVPKNGYLPVPPGPGLGVEVDMDRVDEVSELL